MIVALGRLLMWVKSTPAVHPSDTTGLPPDSEVDCRMRDPAIVVETLALGVDGAMAAAAYPNA
jgi:hypothetical protein